MSDKAEHQRIYAVVRRIPKGRVATYGQIAALAGMELVAYLTHRFLMHGPLLDWDLKIGDEGYLVYGVDRLAGGEVLYRDVLRHYMPGVYYMFVPLFDWFGPSLWTVRAVWLVWLALTCGGVCLLLRPLAPPCPCLCGRSRAAAMPGSATSEPAA